MTIYSKIVNGEVVSFTDQEIEARQAEEDTALTAQLEDYIRDFAEKILNGGFSLPDSGGMFIDTSERSRGLLNGAVTRGLLDNDLGKSYDYYPPGGTKITLTNIQFFYIGQAMAQHAQKALDVKNIAQSRCAAGQYTSTAQVSEDMTALFLEAE